MTTSLLSFHEVNAKLQINFGFLRFSNSYWILWYTLHQRDLPPRIIAAPNVAEALGGGDVSGHARALEPRSFSFPKDHADHPEFRNEWWYFTGNLQNEVGRPFGFQVTLFRNSLVPELPEESGSPWRTNQLYMGHLALSDIQEEHFITLSAFNV